MNGVQVRALFDFLKERKYHVGKDEHQLAYVKAMAHAVGDRPGSANSVFIDAPAGTGKTTLAALVGVFAVERCGLDKIIYIRTENDVGGEERGFLPGDDNAKFAPYAAPFIEALDEAYPGLWEKWAMVEEEVEDDKPNKQNDKGDKPAPRQAIKAVATHPGHFRGKTRSKVFVIIDEAQNWKKSQLQAVYTRFKNDAVVVTIGHSGQCDIPENRQERVVGLLPFQVFALHHHKRGAFVGTLVTNYRGEFAQWSDEVDKTMAELKKSGNLIVFSELLKASASAFTDIA